MKAWHQPLFEEHEGPSVIFPPFCQCTEVLELGDVVVQCISFHFDMHQLLVCILYLRSVSEGLLKCMGESGPQPFVVRVDSLCEVSIDPVHHVFDPVIDHWPTDKADCEANAVEGYQHGVVLTVSHAVNLEFPKEVVAFGSISGEDGGWIAFHATIAPSTTSCHGFVSDILNLFTV